MNSIKKPEDVTMDGTGADDINDQQSLGALMPREFLKKIPGINSHNIGIITKKVKNMIELVRMDEAKLGGLIGKKNAL